jgi:endosialidase-like protein
MEKASEVILSLRPVTFHYKTDTKATPQFGLIAEEVARVNPALVLAVNAMLLNEFLKEHRKVEEQEATFAQLKKDFRATVAQLATRLDEQAAQIQKVSAQLETKQTCAASGQQQSVKADSNRRTIWIADAHRGDSRNR